MARLFAVGLVALLLSGCALPGARAPIEPPRLVVLLVVDGLPQRSLEAHRAQLGPDGLRRFLERGAAFTEAHHGQAFTVTCPGHATILTGAYPERTGIIGNDWIDPSSGEREYCVGDPAHRYLGHPARRLDGTSPRNLRVETLGDVLKRVRPASRVIAVSGKDRGAILTAGRAGVAYAYRPQTGSFASTTYYMQAHPEWVERFNAARPADAYFGREWRPLLEEAAYARSTPDGQPWYRPGGRLPKVVGAGQAQPGPAFYAGLLGTPFIDELTLRFAAAALEAEALGRDADTDLLLVSLSGLDAVNHAYSAESRLSHDHLLQVDRQVQELFARLDAQVGPDRYVALLTADHGFTPAPENTAATGGQGGRFAWREAVARANGELALEFGEGAWILGFSADALRIDHALARARGVAVDAVAEKARALLLREPQVAAVFTRADHETGRRRGEPYHEAMRRSWHPDRSADLQMALKPGWVYSSAGATHGSPHRPDTHVPLLFYGPRWIAPARIGARVEISWIAATLARLLRIPAPEAADHSLLPVGPPLP